MAKTYKVTASDALEQRAHNSCMPAVQVNGIQIEVRGQV